MPPAVGRPWLVTLRSTMKSAIPIRTKITPMAGGITIIGRVPFGRSIDVRMTEASSLESDCTAHRSGDFVLRYGSRSSRHRGAGHRISGLFNATLKATYRSLRKDLQRVSVKVTHIA